MESPASVVARLSTCKRWSPQLTASQLRTQAVTLFSWASIDTRNTKSKCEYTCTNDKHCNTIGLHDLSSVSDYLMGKPVDPPAVKMSVNQIVKVSGFNWLKSSVIFQYWALQQPQTPKHPHYDIAILKLASQVTLSSEIQVACLPPAPSTSYPASDTFGYLTDKSKFKRKSFRIDFSIS